MPLVTDFGISHALATSSARAQTTSGAKGTVRWMAVELFGFGSASSTKATKESDVWAFGMTVYVSVVIDDVLIFLLTHCAGNLN